MSIALTTVLADLERLGRRHKHELGAWTAGEDAFESEDQIPPQVRAQGVRAGVVIDLPRIACSRCEAWAQILTRDGVNCSSPTFDQDCSADHTRLTT